MLLSFLQDTPTLFFHGLDLGFSFNWTNLLFSIGPGWFFQLDLLGFFSWISLVFSLDLLVFSIGPGLF